jgi:hypothetical protein
MSTRPLSGCQSQRTVGPPGWRAAALGHGTAGLQHKCKQARTCKWWLKTILCIFDKLLALRFVYCGHKSNCSNSITLYRIRNNLVIFSYISVTYFDMKITVRQSPQHTRGQQYWMSGLFVSAVMSRKSECRSHDVLSVGPARAPMEWLDSQHVTYVFCDACPCCIYRSVHNS